MQSFLLTVDDYANALHELGQAANAPIVTPAMRDVQQIFAKAGGAAKGSGAGGGDIMVGWLPEDARKPELPRGIREVTMGISDEGLSWYTR